mmetsp:Transcript_8166/g.16481  ORF Transcript_8166/g.16481 Transcript_8166/m.16481 type:complete len:293 (+) Transcript_8166:98-976(+)
MSVDKNIDVYCNRCPLLLLLLLLLLPLSCPLSLTAAPRNIVVLSHDVSDDVIMGLFDDRNLLHHRIDVLSRCISSSLFVSNKLRTATTVFLMLFPSNSSLFPTTVEISGDRVRELNPDERTCALCLQRTLLQGSSNEAKQRVSERINEKFYVPPATPNIYKPGSTPKSERNLQRIERKARMNMIKRIDKAAPPPLGFQLHQDDNLLERVSTLGGTMYLLHEDGDPLWECLPSRSSPPPSPVTLILGDQKGVLQQDMDALSPLSPIKVSLGSLSLLTSQCITIAHHYLDRVHE